MYRINTPADVANTGLVKIDAGEGVALQVPVAPAAGATWATLPGKPIVFPPDVHTHTQAQVTGLVDALAALGYDSGWRNITASITATPAPTGGTILVRRVGKHVYMQVNGITFADSSTSFLTLSNSLIPAGLRPPRTVDFASGRRLVGDTGGSIRVDSNGRGILYQVAGGFPILGTGSWITDEAPPTTPPGTPA